MEKKNITELALVISRNFDIEGLGENPLPEKTEEAFQQLREILASRISELIDHEMEKLLWILYRIDVNEAKLRESIANNDPAQASYVMADLIIQRQLEKIKSREMHRPKHDPSTEDPDLLL